MEDSILITVKKALGIDLEYLGFDNDLIIYINNAFMNLSQLGIGDSTGFLITNSDNLWSEFMEGISNMEGIKSYIILKTRLLFDPPQTSYLIEAIKNQLNEIEFRLNIQVDINGEV